MNGFGTYDIRIYWVADAVRKGDVSLLRRSVRVRAASELYGLERPLLISPRFQTDRITHDLSVSYRTKKDHLRSLRITRQKKQRYPNNLGHSPRPRKPHGVAVGPAMDGICEAITAGV
jgi:hypothetical protein